MPTAVQAPPTSAVEHYRRQQRIGATGLAAARQAFQQGNFTKLLAVVTLFQYLAAQDAAESVEPMLEEQGINPAPVAPVAVGALAGIASDGRALAGLLAQITDLVQLAMIVATQLQDAARTSAGVAITARPQITGYVRMLNPPSCSRCIQLAGHVYRWSDGFERHPKCDCRHIPAAENVAGDLTTDRYAYFESLSREEQDRIFTKAGAQALRDGADMHQVVNSRRGMRTAGGLLQRNDAGQLITTEGKTRRRGERLMPEAIYEIANGDREQALALLRRYGYLTS